VATKSGDRCAAPDGTFPWIPRLRRWWTHGEEELAGLRALFTDSDVGPERDYLGRWRDELVRSLPLVVVGQLSRAWLHGDFHGATSCSQAAKCAPRPA